MTAVDDTRRRQRPGDTGRVMPFDLGAEESLLGACLLNRDAIGEAVERVRPQDFYKPAHGHIFEAVVTLWGAGEPVDPVTVADSLRRAGLLDAAGGPAALVGLQAAVPATSNAPRYARIVADQALLRRLIGVGGEITEIGYSAPLDVREAVDRAESVMFGVAEREAAGDVFGAREWLERILDHTEALYESERRITGVTTGFADLDEQLSGLQRGALYVLGGRPSMGKTALAIAIAMAAATDGAPALFQSLEMSHLEVAMRILAMAARVDLARLRTGRLGAPDWPKISHAVGLWAERSLFIDDNPRLTTLELRAKARRMLSREGLGLIVVDYVQLMVGADRAENRQVEVSKISRDLKVLARELNVPVLALSQLSREVERRADKRPMLADLRESGSLEQDADVVLFVYRDEVYDTTSADRGTAEVIVAKHRNGPTGRCRLAFLEHYALFANMARGV